MSRRVLLKWTKTKKDDRHSFVRFLLSFLSFFSNGKLGVSKKCMVHHSDFLFLVTIVYSGLSYLSFRKEKLSGNHGDPIRKEVIHNPLRNKNDRKRKRLARRNEFRMFTKRRRHATEPESNTDFLSEWRNDPTTCSRRTTTLTPSNVGSANSHRSAIPVFLARETTLLRCRHRFCDYFNCFPAFPSKIEK